MPAAQLCLPVGLGDRWCYRCRFTARSVVPAELRVADFAGAGRYRQSPYPRGRGEHTSQRRKQRDAGSSPRARGTDPAHASGAPSGSSPRARGTGWTWWAISTGAVHPRGRGERLVAPSPDDRFIPAGAGNARHAVYVIRLIGSSPRARGTRLSHEAPSRSAGSSPRARGTLYPLARGRRERFIPAGAGNASRVADRLAPVHPRGRGERLAASLRRAPHGSSPRARGTRRAVRRAAQFRFIPAGAGNASRSGRGRCRTVHPRGRGEQARARCARDRFIPAGAGNATPCVKQRLRRFIPAGAGNARPMQRRRRRGSSPRARGTRPAVIALASWGFIPAGAGNSSRRRYLPADGSSPRARGTPARHRRMRSAVHPRGRGEHWPPSAWREPRFIPAGAGNTASSRQRTLASGSSPRARGTRRGRLPGDADRAGSSPRARGTRAVASTGISRPVHPRGRGEPRACRGDGRYAGAVHPRGRGERAQASGLRCDSGSSPRARGTRAGGARSGPAGSSPRARGTRDPRLGRHWTGSSPRARGTRRRPLTEGRRRFIPAGAGNAVGKCLYLSHATGSSPDVKEPTDVPAPFFSCRGAQSASWAAEGDEAEAVEVDRLAPVAAAGVEVEARRRWVRSRRSRRCRRRCAPSTWSQIRSRVRRRVVADVDAGPHLQEPDREPAAQAGRRVLDDDDHHGPALPSATMARIARGRRPRRRRAGASGGARGAASRRPRAPPRSAG